MYSEEFELGRISGYKNGYVDGQQFAINEILRLNNVILSLKPKKYIVKGNISMSDFVPEGFVCYCDNEGNLNFRPTTADIHEIDEWITHIED